MRPLFEKKKEEQQYNNRQRRTLYNNTIYISLKILSYLVRTSRRKYEKLKQH